MGCPHSCRASCGHRQSGTAFASSPVRVATPRMMTPRSPAGPADRSGAVRSRASRQSAGRCRPRARSRGDRAAGRRRRAPRRGMASAVPAWVRARRGSATAGARCRRSQRTGLSTSAGEPESRVLVITVVATMAPMRPPANTAPMVTSSTNLGLEVWSLAWMMASASTPAADADSNTMRCSQSHLRRVVVSSCSVIGR